MTVLIHSQVTFGYVSKLYYVTVVCSSVRRLRRSNSAKSSSGRGICCFWELWDCDVGVADWLAGEDYIREALT